MGITNPKKTQKWRQARVCWSLSETKKAGNRESYRAVMGGIEERERGKRRDEEKAKAQRETCVLLG